MKSTNPYLRQIGARRLLGYTTTVGIAAPVAMESAQKMTGITEEMYDAYKNRFAPEYENIRHDASYKQQKDKSWKAVIYLTWFLMQM